jgi:6-phosphofructokinase 1
MQRGGSPTPEDRILATRLGELAVRSILEGKTCAMAGEVGGQPRLTPFAETIGTHHAPPPDLLRIVDVMSI